MGRPRGVDEELSENSEGIEFGLEAQAFEFEGGANGQEDVIALGSYGLGGGFSQIGIGLQGFVEHLHLPPFLVGRGNGVIVASQVVANQMQDPRTAVLSL